MATPRISLLGANLLPDSSGLVWFEPYTIKATNDVWKHVVWVFKDNTVKMSLFGTCEIPSNYVGSAKVYAVWSTPTTTGNVVWDFDYRAVGGDDLESLDQAGYQESLTVTDAAPSAANERNVPSVTLTATNLAAGDTLEWQFSRDCADASDTLAADVMLVDLILEFADA